MLNQLGLPYRYGFYGYDLISQKGTVPDEIIKLYKSKDSAVALACYFADSPQFSYLGTNILGTDILGCVPNTNAALRLSEIYTCLSQKIQ